MGATDSSRWAIGLDRTARRSAWADGNRTSRGAQMLRAVGQPLGRGSHLQLARSMAANESRLGTPHIIQQIDGTPGTDPDACSGDLRPQVVNRRSGIDLRHSVQYSPDRLLITFPVSGCFVMYPPFSASSIASVCVLSVCAVVAVVTVPDFRRAV